MSNPIQGIYQQNQLKQKIDPYAGIFDAQKTVDPYAGILGSNNLQPETPYEPRPLWERIKSMVNFAVAAEGLDASDEGTAKAHALRGIISQANSFDSIKESLSGAAEKLLHPFSGIEDGTLKEAFMRAKSNPMAAISGLPEGLVNAFVFAPVRAFTGVKVDAYGSMNVDALVQTPNERAQDIKDVVALAVTSGVAGGASKILKSASSGVITNIAKNVAVGAASGGAFGLVSGAGDPDIKDKIMGGILLGAPLGAIFGEGRTKTALDKNPKVEASDVARVRDLNIKLTNSFGDLITKHDAVMTSEDLVNAVVKTDIAINPGKPSILPNVDAKKAVEVLRNLPDGFKGKYNEQTGDLLIHPKEWKGNTGLFDRSGFLPDEVVSYEGKNYRIKEASPTDLNIIPANGGRAKVVSRADITRTGDIIINNEKVVQAAWEKVKQNMSVMQNDSPEAVALRDQRAELIDHLMSLNKPNIIKANQLAKIETEITQKGYEFQNVDPNEILPTKSFQELVKDYPISIQAGIAQKFKTILTESLEPSEKILYDSYANKVEPPKLTIQDFEHMSNRNAYDLDLVDGQFHLKDLHDPQRRTIYRTNNFEDLRKFINESGQDKGINLDNGSSNAIPTDFSNEALKPIVEKTRFGRSGVGTELNLNFSWFTNYGEWFKSADKAFGTNFYASIFDPLQTKATLRDAHFAPLTERFKTINDLFGSKLSIDRREVVGRWLEAASPETIIQEGYASGPMKPQEVEIAKSFNDSDALASGFKYRRTKNNIIENKSKVSPEEQALQLKQLDTEYDASAKKVATQLDALSQLSPEDVNIGRVVRLARAINSEALDRAGFEKSNKMNTTEKQLGYAIESEFKTLAKHFNVDPGDLINYYMSHAKTYADGDMSWSLNQFARSANPKSTDFYAKLARTGELDDLAYETDPLKALYRYGRAGSNELSGFNEAVANAKQAINNNLARPGLDSKVMYKLRLQAESYINDIQGRVPAGSQMSQGALDRIQASESIMGRLVNKITDDADVRSVMTDMMKVTNTAFIGGRPSYGLVLDNMSSWLTSSGWWGYAKAGRIFVKGVKEWQAGSPLIAEGKVSGISISKLSNPVDDLSISEAITKSGGLYKKFSSAIDKMGAAGLKWSGQGIAYDIWRQGAYRDALDTYQPLINKIVRGEITTAKFYKEIKLTDNYHPTTAVEIAKRVDAGLTNDLADFMAREDVKIVSPTFGLANNPAGWNRTVGRVTGQFGSYAAWSKTMAQNSVAIGSYGARAARLARYAAGAATLYEIGQLGGTNLGPYMPHNFFFHGGPIANLTGDILGSFFGSGIQRDISAANVKRALIPYTEENGFNPVIWLPFSGLMNDVIKSVDSNNPVRRIIGLRDTREGEEPSLIRDVMPGGRFLPK